MTKAQIIELLKEYPEEHLDNLFDDDLMKTLRINYDLLLAVRKSCKPDMTDWDNPTGDPNEDTCTELRKGITKKIKFTDVEKE